MGGCLRVGGQGGGQAVSGRSFEYKNHYANEPIGVGLTSPSDEEMNQTNDERVQIT